MGERVAVLRMSNVMMCSVKSHGVARRDTKSRLSVTTVHGVARWDMQINNARHNSANGQQGAVCAPISDNGKNLQHCIWGLSTLSSHSTCVLTGTSVLAAADIRQGF